MNRSDGVGVSEAVCNPPSLGYVRRYPFRKMSVPRLTIPVLFLLASTIGCERRPRIPTYQFVDNVPILTSRSADDVILLASDYCKENGIDLRQREMPVMSYDTLDGVGYWCVLYHGLTRKPGDHFMLLIQDATGEIEYVPGA